MFWFLDDNQIPHNHQLIQQTTATGDHCHYIIEGITDTNARNYFEDFWGNPANFNYCRGNTTEELTQDLLSGFLSLTSPI